MRFARICLQGISRMTPNPTCLQYSPQVQGSKNQRVVGAALQKLNEVPDNEVPFRCEPWPCEAQWPHSFTAHPRARDIRFRSLEVKVVRHGTNRNKLGDKCFNVPDLWRWRAEQEFVTCLPDPFPQNSEPFRRFRRVGKIKCCDRPELWYQGV